MALTSTWCLKGLHASVIKDRRGLGAAPHRGCAPQYVRTGHPPVCRLRSQSLRVRGERALAAETVMVEGLGRKGLRLEPVSDIESG